MAYQLSQAVTAYVAEHRGVLAGAEIAVLFALAERASYGRSARAPGLAWDSDDWSLCWYAGVKDPSGLRRILGKLADKGLECRVAYGLDSRGRPTYAHRGRQTTYRVPEVIHRLAVELAAEPEKAAPNGTPSVPNGTPSVPIRAPSVPIRAPSPVLSSPSQSFPSPLPPAAEHGHADKNGGAGEDREEQERTDEGSRLVAEFLSLPAAPKLGQADRRRLTAAVAAALDTGCTRMQCREALEPVLPANAHSPAAVLVARIAKLSPMERHIHAAPSKPAWCGVCDEHSRLAQHPERDALVKCSACHPSTKTGVPQ